MSVLPAFWLLFIGIVAANAGLYRKDELGAEDRDFFLHPDQDRNIMNVNLKEGDFPSNFKFNPAKDIHLNLYTKRNPSESQQLRPDDDVGLWVSNFQATNPTRLLVHGWMTQADDDYILLKDTYLSHQDMNVIIVDWKAGSNNIDYIDAKDNVPIVAAYIARFLDQVVAKTGIKTSSIQLVGEHLGAHVVGLAGRQIKSGRIHTITGLEPALPLYSINDRGSRINEDSADYVEIIHTSRGVIGVGFYEPIGHADFYPNAVYTQPGCGLDLDGSCSHERALEFFIESLSSDTGFWSWNCESFVGLKNKQCRTVGELRPMGVLKGVTTNQGLAKGIYYLKTNSASPYAKGPPDHSQLGEVIAVNND